MADFNLNLSNWASSAAVRHHNWHVDALGADSLSLVNFKSEVGGRILAAATIAFAMLDALYTSFAAVGQFIVTGAKHVVQLFFTAEFLDDYTLNGAKASATKTVSLLSVILSPGAILKNTENQYSLLRQNGLIQPRRRPDQDQRPDQPLKGKDGANANADAASKVGAAAGTGTGTGAGAGTGGATT